MWEAGSRGRRQVIVRWESGRVTDEWIELYFSNPRKVSLPESTTVSITTVPDTKTALVEFDNVTDAEIERLCATEHALDQRPVGVSPWTGTKSEFWAKVEGRGKHLRDSSQPPTSPCLPNPVNSNLRWEKKISQREEPFLALLWKSKSRKGILKRMSINTAKGVISMIGTSQEITLAKMKLQEYIETTRNCGQSRAISPTMSAILRRAGGPRFLEGLLRDEDSTAVVCLTSDRLEVFVDSAEAEEVEMALTHILHRKLITRVLPVKEGQLAVLKRRLSAVSLNHVSVEGKGTIYYPTLHIQGLTKDVSKVESFIMEGMSYFLRESSPLDIDIVTGALKGLSIDDAPFVQPIDGVGRRTRDHRNIGLRTGDYRMKTSDHQNASFSGGNHAELRPDDQCHIKRAGDQSHIDRREDQPHCERRDDQPHVWRTNDQRHIDRTDDQHMEGTDDQRYIDRIDDQNIERADDQRDVWRTDDQRHGLRTDDQRCGFEIDTLKKKENPQSLVMATDNTSDVNLRQRICKSNSKEADKTNDGKTRDIDLNWVDKTNAVTFKETDDKINVNAKETDDKIVNFKGTDKKSDVDVNWAVQKKDEMLSSTQEYQANTRLTRTDCEGHTGLVATTTINETLQSSEIRFIETHLEHRLIELHKFFEEVGGNIGIQKDTSVLSFSFPGNHKSAHGQVKELLALFSTDVCRMPKAGSYNVLTSPEGRARLADLEKQGRSVIEVSRYQGPGWWETVDVDEPMPDGGADETDSCWPDVGLEERVMRQGPNTPPRETGKALQGTRTAAEPTRKKVQKEKTVSSRLKARVCRRLWKTNTKGDCEYSMGVTKLVLTHDSITQTEAAVLVHILDRKFSLDSKLSQKFLADGGKGIKEAILRHKAHERKGLIVTRGFSIPGCQFIYHAPLSARIQRDQGEVVAGVVNEALNLANTYHSPSVAFPTLDAFPLKIEPRSMAESFFTALVDFLVDNICMVQVIKLCVPNKDKFRIVQQYFAEVIPNAHSILEGITQQCESECSSGNAPGSPTADPSDTRHTRNREGTDESFAESSSYRLAPSAGAVCQITAHQLSDIQAAKTELDAIVRDLLADKVVNLPADCWDELALKIFKFCIKKNVIQLPDKAHAKIRLVGTRQAVESAEGLIWGSLRSTSGAASVRETSL